MNSEIYQNHILDMNGVILWTTDISPLSTDCVIGKNIREILYPGDAYPISAALFKAATGQNHQWYKYSIKDDAFLSLIEYLPEQRYFSIHEARMTGSNDTKKFKSFLMAASGCYQRTPVQPSPF